MPHSNRATVAHERTTSSRRLFRRSRHLGSDQQQRLLGRPATMELRNGQRRLGIGVRRRRTTASAFALYIIRRRVRSVVAIGRQGSMPGRAVQKPPRPTPKAIASVKCRNVSATTSGNSKGVNPAAAIAAAGARAPSVVRRGGCVPFETGCEPILLDATGFSRRGS